MAQVRWSRLAEQDVRDIEEFVARDSVAYAVRLVNRISEAVERLEVFPLSGHIVPARRRRLQRLPRRSLEVFPLSGHIVPEFEREDLREVLFRAYRVVYLVNDDVVTVLRVVHGARDLIRLLGDNP